MLGSSRSPLTRNGPEVVLARLRRLAPLKPHDEALLATLKDWRHDPVNAELTHDLSSTPARYLVSGWAARIRWLADGRRQIVSFILPGDALGVSRRPQPRSQCTVVALTPVQTVDGQAVLRALDDPEHHEALIAAVALAAALDEAWMIEQIVRLGRLTAYERLAHLLLELRARLMMTGLSSFSQMPFPLTQEALADASGLSIVHVNRTIQQLRRDNLIELRGGQVRFLDPQALADIADFREPKVASQPSTTDTRQVAFNLL